MTKFYKVTDIEEKTTALIEVGETVQVAEHNAAQSRTNIRSVPSFNSNDYTGKVVEISSAEYAEQLGAWGFFPAQQEVTEETAETPIVTLFTPLVDPEPAIIVEPATIEEPAAPAEATEPTPEATTQPEAEALSDENAEAATALLPEAATEVVPEAVAEDSQPASTEAVKAEEENFEEPA